MNITIIQAPSSLQQTQGYQYSWLLKISFFWISVASITGEKKILMFTHMPRLAMNVCRGETWRQPSPHKWIHFQKLRSCTWVVLLNEMMCPSCCLWGKTVEKNYGFGEATKALPTHPLMPPQFSRLCFFPNYYFSTAIPSHVPTIKQVNK